MTALGSYLTTYLGTDRLACMDVGAAGGVHGLWRPYGEVIEVDAFEPNAAACAYAAEHSEPYVKWFPVALGGHTGTQKFYVLNAPSGSSFYPPNDDEQRFFNDSHYRGIDRVVDIETITVADFLRQHARPAPNLLKLDTQGSELDILRTLDDEHWDAVLTIEVEVEFIELYRGQPLFRDVDDYLRERGMLLFDLRTAREYCSAHDTTGYYTRKHLNFAVGRNDLSARLYAGDALYVRDFITRPVSDRGLLLKLVAAMMIYSFFDYALYLVDDGHARGILGASEHATLMNEIVTCAPRPRTWERADEIGDKARRLMASHRVDDTTYQAFWMIRNWPNQ
ncbi:MAG: FkbM family methyltransferase [Gammaproteobacteria bacterium]